MASWRSKVLLAAVTVFIDLDTAYVGWTLPYSKCDGDMLWNKSQTDSLTLSKYCIFIVS